MYSWHGSIVSQYDGGDYIPENSIFTGYNTRYPGIKYSYHIQINKLFTVNDAISSGKSTDDSPVTLMPKDLLAWQFIQQVSFFLCELGSKPNTFHIISCVHFVDPQH